MEVDIMAEDQALEILDAEKQELVDSVAERTRDVRAFVPRADIYETDEAIVVVTDMPGVNADSVDIMLEENVLTINGYVEPTKPEGHTLAYAEYEVGDFVRAFTISNQFNRDGIEATVKDGVLTLYLPKITEAQKRKIAIKAA
jgi:HSP20 family molecular chaperone IbpA